MAKKKNSEEKTDKEQIEKTKEENEQVENNEKESVKDNDNDLQKALDDKQIELSNANDKYLRVVAEYDNFKRRTAKEKEQLYKDSVSDVIKEVLPILDNLERALTAFTDKENEYYKGVEMVLKQTQDIFSKLGVETIKSVGEEFNPELHNAVMHIDDDKVADNTIVEEFQKGYVYKDKVIRYSMVKVAN